MGKGLIIVVVTMAIGAAILLPFFDAMYANPPPVTQIRVERPPSEQPPAQAGTTTIAILAGAATQGNPDFDPDEAQVPLGNKIVWDNQDTVPHTATSGTGPDDPASAELFDTSIINAGESSDPIELEGVSEGDTISYYCVVHPYMTGSLTIAAAEEGGSSGGGAAAGPTITIPSGASVQGNTPFEPAELTASAGAEVTVMNQDNVPHTVTSGTGNSDPDKGKLFDTSLVNGGDSSTISLADVAPGQYDYFCIVHEYMKGVLIVE
jgi:plastocyanin